MEWNGTGWVQWLLDKCIVQQHGPVVEARTSLSAGHATGTFLTVGCSERPSFIPFPFMAMHPCSRGARAHGSSTAEQLACPICDGTDTLKL